MKLKFEAGNNEKYKVDGIWDHTVYIRESARQPPGFYYLVLWKGYTKKENIRESSLAIQDLWKLVTHTTKTIQRSQ